MATPRTNRGPVLDDMPISPLVGEGTSDQELLERFTKQKDAAALAVLVQRYGPMVHDVCRSILAKEHDAEDAFQATFLVLLNRAASIRQPELLRTWLHRVASRIAHGLDPDPSPASL
jgi:hypothetical protein